MAIGFNWKRANATAANVAIISSLLINFGVKVSGASVPFGIDVGALSLLVSLTLFFGLSLAIPLQDIDPDIEQAMDL